jgi:hypothetical protein
MPTLPKPRIGDVMKILFIDGRKPHHYRPLDYFVLKRGDANGPLPSALLGKPDPFNRRCLIATFLQPSVEIV